jgi:hypothetical protein
MKRIAHIVDGFIANVSIAADNAGLPAGTILEADALSQGFTRRPKTEQEIADEYRATNPPRWIEFWAALPADVDALLAAARAASPRLELGLGVGLGKAADGDSRVFLSAWQQAKSLGLIPPELVAGVQELAVEFDLPAEFVGGLGSTL